MSELSREKQLITTPKNDNVVPHGQKRLVVGTLTDLNDLTISTKALAKLLAKPCYCVHQDNVRSKKDILVEINGTLILINKHMQLLISVYLYILAQKFAEKHLDVEVQYINNVFLYTNTFFFRFWRQLPLLEYFVKNH
jgi:hypothetical protein